MASIQITPIASLDWPSELSKGRVQCGTASYVRYKARRDERISFHHFSSFKTSNGNEGANNGLKDVKDVMRSKSKQEGSEAKQVDLKTLSAAELDEMSYYDILGGIKMHSTPEQVKRAFHKACLKYHPDKEGKGQSDAGSSNGGGGTGEDPVFLKVKEAFETLSDKTKRRAYDSTVDFDDSVPSEKELNKITDNKKKEAAFYEIFGPVFERNLRFAAENDPDRKVNTPSNKKNKKKKNGKNGQKKEPMLLGDETTDMDKVHSFYEYWVNFESWRDFTLPATKLTEHDTDLADCRYEKRWMEKEIARKAKAMKKDEMARITKLVETAMKLDPRLKREKIRLDLEKAEKIQKKKDEEARKKKEEEQRLAKEEAERVKQEAIAAKEKAEAKAKRDQEKKVLRKARQGLRRLVLAEYEKETEHAEKHDTVQQTWTSIEDMNDDVETLCDKLNAMELTSLTESLTAGNKGAADLAIVVDRANDQRDDNAKAKKAAQRARENARLEAKRKEAVARKKRAATPWAKEEMSALAKAVKKYPAGGANRWETIAIFVNNLCKLDETRTKEECIEKYNNLSKGKMDTSRATSSSSTSTATSTSKAGASEASDWTEEQDRLLQEGLKKYPSSMDKNERWTNIAKCVPGKKKKECVTRFKAIREALKNK